MTTWALGTVAPRGGTTRMSGTAMALVVAAAACLVASQLSVDAWLAATTMLFASALAWPFVTRRIPVDTGNPLVFFLAYFAFAMLLRGLGLLTFVDSPYLRELGDARSAHFRRLVADVFFWCAALLVCLYAGWQARAGTRLARVLLERVPGLAAPWRPSRLRGAIALLLGLGLLGAVVRLKAMGGFQAVTGDLIGAGTEQALGRWWLIALTEFAVVGFHVWAVGRFLRDGAKATRPVLCAALLFAAPLYVVTSSKFLIIRVVFLTLVWRHFLVRPLPVRTLLLVFAGFGLMFPLFYAYRAVGLVGLDGVRTYLETTDAPLLKIFHRAYDADSFMLVLHRAGREVPLEWGRTLIDAFVFWIPRALWAAKPMSFGLTFAQGYMPDFQFTVMTYMSPSLPGELWANFAWPGVLAGGFGIGVLLRASWEAVHRGGPSQLLLHGFWFLTVVHLVEGSIAAQFANFVTDVVPLLLATWMLTRVHSHPAQVPASARR